MTIPANTIRARLEFSFKGEDHVLETVIDLDTCHAADGEMPDFHRMLARSHGIDSLSYAYEVLESCAIEFDAPTGLATSCCEGGVFDWPRFCRLRQDEQDLQAVRGIAARTIGTQAFEAREDLRMALLAAYRAGLSRRPG
jgi:hypothetical protein